MICYINRLGDGALDLKMGQASQICRTDMSALMLGKKYLIFCTRRRVLNLKKKLNDQGPQPIYCCHVKHVLVLRKFQIILSQ